jgi:hypothetical protein
MHRLWGQGVENQGMGWGHPITRSSDRFLAELSQGWLLSSLASSERPTFADHRGYQSEGWEREDDDRD